MTIEEIQQTSTEDEELAQIRDHLKTMLTSNVMPQPQTYSLET